MFTYLLHTFPGQGDKLHVLHDEDNKPIAAEPGREYLLRSMAQRLQADGLIGKAILVKSDGLPIS